MKDLQKRKIVDKRLMAKMLEEAAGLYTHTVDTNNRHYVVSSNKDQIQSFKDSCSDIFDTLLAAYRDNLDDPAADALPEGLGADGEGVGEDFYGLDITKCSYDQNAETLFIDFSANGKTYSLKISKDDNIVPVNDFFYITSALCNHVPQNINVEPLVALVKSAIERYVANQEHEGVKTYGDSIAKLEDAIDGAVIEFKESVANQLQDSADQNVVFTLGK